MENRIYESSGTLTRQGGFVLYWMQQAQRVHCNPALEFAFRQAEALRLPLQVVFILSDTVPEANLRHYRFLVEGLAETGRQLAELKIPFILIAADSVEAVTAATQKCALIVFDHGYLKLQRSWRNQVKQLLPEIPWFEVESDVVVPVKVASGKEEYAAATLRGKLLRQLEHYLQPCPTPGSLSAKLLPIRIPDLPMLSFTARTTFEQVWEFASTHLKMDDSVSPVTSFRGGYSEAIRRLEHFLQQHLRFYQSKRNDPALSIQSNLSPYLHFGQISSLEIALRTLEYSEIPPYAAALLIKDKANPDPLQGGVAAFLEELIVRRELSCNFCHYNPDYDHYRCLPLWARQSLNNHLHDPRPRQYSLDNLESANTDDPYWNAAQTEMLTTGKMHNYMRMYWGKKLIEWSPDPETAFELMLYLNNKYELDGRDVNSYAGIAWCFGKHDRPWQERDIFGSVRYMNMNGLNRKFDLAPYLARVHREAAAFQAERGSNQ